MSLSSVLGTLAGKVSGFITKDVVPALLNLLGVIEHDVVSLIIPMAAEALTEIGTGIATGGTQTVAGDLDIVAAVAKATLPKVEKAALSATSLDIVTAAQAAVAAAGTALAKTATPAPAAAPAA